MTTPDHNPAMLALSLLAVELHTHYMQMRVDFDKCPRGNYKDFDKMKEARDAYQGAVDALNILQGVL